MTETLTQIKHSKLTMQERLFVEAYYKTGYKNSTDVYMKLFPKVTRSSARSLSSRLLKRSHVKQYIQELETRRYDRYELTADRVIQGLARGAFWDPKDLENPDGSLKKVHEIPENTRLAINGIMGERRYLMVDRAKCLELLGKYLALFKEKHLIDGTLTGDIRISVNFTQTSESQAIQGSQTENKS